eukprot:5000926-Amphidinium_carterae.1
MGRVDFPSVHVVKNDGCQKTDHLRWSIMVVMHTMHTGCSGRFRGGDEVQHHCLPSRVGITIHTLRGNPEKIPAISTRVCALHCGCTHCQCANANS